MALTANARNWENIEPRNFSKAAQHYREAIEIIWRYPDEHKEKMDIIEVPHKIDRYIACKIVSYDQRNQHYKLFVTHQELIKIIKPEVFDFIILLDFAGDPELGDQLKRNYPQNNRKNSFEDLYYCFRQNQFEKLQSLINSDFSEDPRKFLLWAIIKYIQESPEFHNNLIRDLNLEHKQHWLKLFAVGYFRKYAPQKLQGYLEQYETLFQG